MNQNTKPKILNDFSKYLRTIRGYSEKTIEGYVGDLILFFRFIIDYMELNIPVTQINIFVLNSVKESDVIAFMVYLNNTRNNTACTRQRKLASIKCFYEWLCSKYGNNLKKNPTKNMPIIRKVVRLPKYLTITEAKKICNIYNLENSKYPERNNLIIKLFLNTGLRLSELTNINLSDINFKESYIRVIGKGNKERKVYLNENLKENIHDFINKQYDNKITDITLPLFVSSQNHRIGNRAIQTICKNAFKLIGLEDRNFTTHTLRHTYATIMYQLTNDVILLKELLGHASINATQIYTHIENKKLKKVFESNPLNKVT